MQRWRGMKPITRMGLMVIIAYFSVLTTLMAGEKRGMHVPDAANGVSLVRSLCINCHVIPDTIQNASPAGIPTFREIANRPGQTVQAIYAALILPHYPMPDNHLTKADMHDIVAYFNKLRTNTNRPDRPPVQPKTKDNVDRLSMS